MLIHFQLSLYFITESGYINYIISFLKPYAVCYNIKHTGKRRYK
ncbi:hypothetical protein HMPREF0080_01026 [Anaeroglobus geminatus F0357]|uniref:Uncharacterized protein n=1 Tax=Anaeroglobus geminatus F0357 TaxID=861450 RepID=G9YH99_9FIRM|nr:hypothetical protein HMPREF0080_01026 [Anaeroglobus geminatus F0357]